MRLPEEIDGPASISFDRGTDLGYLLLAMHTAITAELVKSPVARATLQPLAEAHDLADKRWERAPYGPKRKAALKAKDAACRAWEAAIALEVAAGRVVIGGDAFAR